MKTRIKLFFSSPDFRKLCFKSIKNGIIIFFQRLINPFVTFIEVIKFKKRYPDRWERYVAVKKMEKQNEEFDRIKEITFQRMKLTHATTLMVISMLAYVDMTISVNSGGEADSSKVEELKMNFSHNKAEALDAIESMRNLEAFVPEEFDTEINHLKLNSFDNFKDVQAVGEAFHEYNRHIEYGERK